MASKCNRPEFCNPKPVLNQKPHLVLGDYLVIAMLKLSDLDVSLCFEKAQGSKGAEGHNPPHRADSYYFLFAVRVP